MADKTFISATEAAQRLGVDTSTIRRACKSERLTCEHSGGVWIVEVKSLDTFKREKPGRKKKSRKP